MKPYQKIVIISEIFPEYGLAETSVYLRRVEKINDEEVLNIGHLYDTIQTLKKKGKKKVLLQLPRFPEGHFTSLPARHPRRANLARPRRVRVQF